MAFARSTISASLSSLSRHTSSAPNARASSSRFGFLPVVITATRSTPTLFKYIAANSPTGPSPCTTADFIPSTGLFARRDSSKACSAVGPAQANTAAVSGLIDAGILIRLSTRVKFTSP